MIKINFTVEADVDGSVHEFDMGDMVINIDGAEVSSKGQVPSQSMMIFIAITDLLDGLRSFLIRKKNGFEFIGSDSSFRLRFTRVKKGRIRLTHANINYDGIDETELKNEVLKAAEDFFGQFDGNVQGRGAATGDLSSAIRDFKSII
ncbi:MAG: hypothetical protein OQJ89_05470 [Kangiellaceae bacterium]|nr:hypothetical protein [Kangiellaceae bacterium]MCW9016392.1 hypothetical protein [Kangiellaceae bacterium]